jgi:hypothetical protein
MTRWKYGDSRPYSGNNQPKKPRPIPPELTAEILRIAEGILTPRKTIAGVVCGPNQTMASLLRGIDRALRSSNPQETSRSQETIIRRVLEAAAAQGKIRLPPKKTGKKQ